MHRLEEVILAGPPRSRYQDDIEPEQWAMLVEHAIWLRLVKLESGGAKISDIALQRLTEIRAVHPDLKLSPHEKEEFSHWMSGTGDPDYESNREIDIAPKRRRDLVKWLKQAPPLDRLSYEDTWREMCRNHFPQSFLALYVLAKEDFWSAMRWRVALQTWSENGKILRSWRFAAPLVQTMPIHILQEVKHAVAWWLENVAKSIERHEDIFLKLCQRILELPYLEPEAADNNRPLDKAINHPIGLTTQALLSLWFKRSPNDNDMLPEDISPMFTQLSDTQNESYRHGRVLLASNLIALFRVDRSWTEKNLLPLFNWNTNHKEAKAVWEGFLWSPRLYRPLLTSLKPYFLETANHYSDLGNHNQQYVTFLTYAALESIEGYTPQDFASTIAALPNEGFKFVAQALSQALESSGDQRENYWKHRVQPFWQQIWPKSRDRTTPEIVGFLARLCIAAGAEFPSSLETIHDWLIPIDHPNDIIWRLKSFNLCERFPDESLRLLDAVISNQQWLPHELKDCLDAITLANPELRNDSRYRKLDELVRRRGT